MKPASDTRPLTGEERTLVLSVPGVVERAAYELCKQYGQLLPFPELVSLGHLAVVLAAQSYDPARGVAFGPWAFYRALGAMLDGARREHKQRTIADAARAAACRYLAQEKPVLDDDVFSESDETLQARYSAFADGLTASLATGAAAASLGGEDLVAEQDAWSYLLEALRRVLDALPADQRELLDLCYAQGETLKRAAKLQGVNYFGLLDRHQALLKLVGARLRGAGVTEAMQPPAEGWQPVLAPTLLKDFGKNDP